MTKKAQKYTLYIDETGSRNPDKKSYNSAPRDDKMDCFGFGGILIKEEDAKKIVSKHKKFCSKWEIDYPLHSTEIRGKRDNFNWLNNDSEIESQFHTELAGFLLSLPIIGIACIIDRPGYITRYKEHYGNRLPYMCKKAFCILVERAAKFSDKKNRRLDIFFEEAGKNEDRSFERYMKCLRNEGNPFNHHTSARYKPMLAEDYRRIVDQLRRKRKTNPLIQIADLVLYPIAKGGYDPSYLAYDKLKERGKLIDCLLSKDQIPSSGIKYSCFKSKKNKDSENQRLFKDN